MVKNIEVVEMKVEVLSVKGLQKEIDEDRVEFWTAPEDCKEFVILVRLNGRKREIRFHRWPKPKRGGDIIFYSDLVHKKFIDALEQELSKIGLEPDEVWIRHEYCDIELDATPEKEKLWF